MNILCIYAHQDPASFGAALHNRLLGTLEKAGHTVVVSDLYGLGFQPAAATWDFKTTGGPHQNYMLEQQRVVFSGERSGFAEDIQDQMDKVHAADLLLFEFPLWWSSPPAIVKGWMDKVLAMGFAWDGDHRYGSGLLRGKQAFVVVSAGDPDQNYSLEGIHGASISQHLYPLLHSTLAQCGLDVHTPFIASNLTASSDEERQNYLSSLESRLQLLSDSPEFIYKQAA